jgi:hypothetical protein
MMKHSPLNPFLIFRALAFHKFRSKQADQEKDDKETDKRPQRDEHKKDEAIEEYVEPNPNQGTEEKPIKPEEEGEMGRSDKAKNQPSDERDRYKDK